MFLKDLTQNGIKKNVLPNPGGNNRLIRADVIEAVIAVTSAANAALRKSDGALRRHECFRCDLISTSLWEAAQVGLPGKFYSFKICNARFVLKIYYLKVCYLKICNSRV